MVVFWTSAYVVMGLNSDEIKFFFISYSCDDVVLHYARNYYTKVVYFLKTITVRYCMTHTVSGPSVNPISKICLSAMLVSVTIEK